MTDTGENTQDGLTARLIKEAMKNPTDALNRKILEQGIKDDFVGVGDGNPVSYHWKLGGKEKATNLPTKIEYQIFDKLRNAEGLIANQLEGLAIAMTRANGHLKPFGLILSEEDGSIVTL